MGDLIGVPKSQFVSQFGEKTGKWLYNVVRGIENEPVTSRQLPKSIGCGKIFPKQSSLSTKKEVTHWLKQLSSELEERLIKDQNINKRFARLLTMSIRNRVSNGYSLVSRSCPIHVYNADKLARDALLAVSKLNTSSSETLWTPSIYTLSIVASKFEDKVDTSCSNIQSFLVNSKSSEKRDGIGNEVESTSSASVKPESNTRTDQSLNTFTLKSAKYSGGVSKSITSFFNKEQIDKIETVSNMESEATKEVQGPDQNSDSLVTSHANDSVTSSKLNDEKNQCVEENSINLIEEQSKSLGFFARNLSEHSDFNFDIEFEQSFSESDPTLTETGDKSIPSTSSVSDICSYLDPELTKICDQCNKRFPVWEETEHLDYHMAVNLSKELSKPSLVNNSHVNKSSGIEKSTAVYKSKGRGKKRSGTTKSSPQAKKSVQKNTLDAFIK